MTLIDCYGCQRGALSCYRLVHLHAERFVEPSVCATGIVRLFVVSLSNHNNTILLS